MGTGAGRAGGLCALAAQPALHLVEARRRPPLPGFEAHQGGIKRAYDEKMTQIGSDRELAERLANEIEWDDANAPLPPVKRPRDS